MKEIDSLIRWNIQQVCRRLKRKGTVGIGIDNLYQLTPTTNIPFDVTLRQYREAFDRVCSVGSIAGVTIQQRGRFVV